MFLNIAIIIIVALTLAKLFELCKLPALLGMILTGVLLAPTSICAEYIPEYLQISDEVLHISKELRSVALIVILIRAGLGINRTVLNKIGVSALKMSCIPCVFEGITIIIIAPLLLSGFDYISAGMLAFIIAAVSPAVIVPQMLDLKEMGFGKNKEVPTLVLAGASIDDVFAITLFTSFVAVAQNGETSVAKMLLNIPISITTGIVIGFAIGFFLLAFFKRFPMRDTKKVLIFLIAAILFHSLEDAKLFPVASLLGIMAIGFIILEKNEDLAKRLADKFNRIWVLAEILLFAMIGAAVDIKVIFSTGIIAVALILLALVGRSLGVMVALAGSDLNLKEKLFCVIAYWPKATVQAAIGAIPLTLGLPHGEEILAIAVLAIVITAPMGAIGIRLTSEKLLHKDM